MWRPPTASSPDAPPDPDMHKEMLIEVTIALEITIIETVVGAIA